MTGYGEERHGQRDPVVLAAHLREAAIELLHGRGVERGRLALLLETAATALLNRGELSHKTPSSSGVERLASIKDRHPRAYERWTPEEDAQLRQQHAEGRSTAELAAAFERQPSAIKSRLQRLGLEPPSEQS